MPILIHGLGVLSNIDELRKGQNNYLMKLFMSHRVTRNDDDYNDSYGDDYKDDYHGDDHDDDNDNTDSELGNKTECFISICVLSLAIITVVCYTKSLTSLRKEACNFDNLRKLCNY